MVTLTSVWRAPRAPGILKRVFAGEMAQDWQRLAEKAEQQWQNFIKHQQMQARQ